MSVGLTIAGGPLERPPPSKQAPALTSAGALPGHHRDVLDRINLIRFAGAF